jgi:hypothetical protein
MIRDYNGQPLLPVLRNSKIPFIIAPLVQARRRCSIYVGGDRRTQCVGQKGLVHGLGRAWVISRLEAGHTVIATALPLLFRARQRMRVSSAIPLSESVRLSALRGHHTQYWTELDMTLPELV